MTDFDVKWFFVDFSMQVSIVKLPIHVFIESKSNITEEIYPNEWVHVSVSREGKKVNEHAYVWDLNKNMWQNPVCEASSWKN